MRRIRILSLTCWLLFSLWSVVFYWLWHADVTWPHAAWAVVSLGSMIVLGIWLALSCVREIHRRWRQGPHHRLAIVGWFLLGIAPLAWFGAHWLDTGLAFRQRIVRPRSLVIVVTQTWLSSFFEGVSRLRFQRTLGDNVVLMHPRDYHAPDQLVAEMDQHILAMTDLLGVEPADSVAWVRGSLVSTTGVAIGPWSITDVDQDRDALTSLDRHEVAHTVIGGLSGRDHHPPRLLVEGWAQFQSTDRSDSIQQLADDYQRHAHFKIDELIEQPWYSASRWPLYQYGGPFVTFLVERFSGDQFLRLYREARQETFRDDVGRVMGVDWFEIEAQFWDWLVTESETIMAEEANKNGLPFALEFADDVSQRDWGELIERYRGTEWTTRHLPDDVAFAVDAVVDDVEDGQPFTRKLEAVFEGGNYWLIYRSPFGDLQSVVMRPSDWASVTRKQDGALTGVSGNNKEHLAEVRQQANHLIQMARNSVHTDPGRFAPIGPKPLDSVTRFRCELLQKPSDDSTLWHMRYRRWMMDEESGDQMIEQTGQLWMDEQKQFAVTRSQRDCAAFESHDESEASYAEFGGMMIPTKMVMRSTWESQPSSGLLTVRPLSATEALSVKRRADRLATSLVIHQRKAWFEYVLYLTYLIPLIGLCCILLARPKQSSGTAAAVL